MRQTLSKLPVFRIVSLEMPQRNIVFRNHPIGCTEQNVIGMPLQKLNLGRKFMGMPYVVGVDVRQILTR
jgi:hypothetical protein